MVIFGECFRFSKNKTNQNQSNVEQTGRNVQVSQNMAADLLSVHCRTETLHRGGECDILTSARPGDVLKLLSDESGYLKGPTKLLSGRYEKVSKAC